MDMTELFLSHPHDHVMANTWRLIFERRSTPSKTKSSLPTRTDLSLLEQLLPEYRLIGLSLANSHKQSAPD